MELFDLGTIFSLSTLLAIALGTFAGLLIGALPGLGATIAIVMLLPLTYAMSPLAAILLLVAAYQAAEYGGSVSSIILGIPGTPAAVATIIDGYPLSKKSYPGKALGYSLMASTIGGLIGAIGLLAFGIPLASLAIRFSDPEFFLIALLGLLAVGGLSSKDKIKSTISVVLGLMLGTIGLDVFTGANRFTMNQTELMEGVSLVAVLIGIFAFAEMFNMASKDIHKKYVTETKGLGTHITWKEFRGVYKNIFKGSLIGSVVGIFPGMGAGPASWFAYSEAKRSSKHPETFGKGEPNGIVAPESSNNATVGGAFIPLLALGIPGSPATAIILGAFLIHGIQPGPGMFESESQLVYTIILGFFIATIFMFLFGKVATPLFARVLKVPNNILVPTILLLAMMGVYISNTLHFDLWVALIFGILAFIMVKLDFSLPSFILAFILSPIIEESLRRSLILSDGSFTIFFERTYALILVGIILFALIGMVFKWFKGKN